MDQLAVLREIRSRLGKSGFTKLEIGHCEPDKLFAESTSRIVIFVDGWVFSYWVADSEWENSELIVGILTDLQARMEGIRALCN